MKILNIIINGMEMISRTIVSTLMLFMFLRYFNNHPNLLLIIFSLYLILFLLIIDCNRSVYEEPDNMFDGKIIDKNRDCCNYDDDDDCFGYYDEVDNDDCVWNDDEDYSQWNQDGGNDGIENYDDDDDHGDGEEDDDILTRRIEDYIANVYNGWREERRTEKLFV